MEYRIKTFQGDISYQGLFQMMERKGIRKKELRELYGISPTTIKMVNDGKAISLTTVLYLCDILECDIPDIVAYQKSES